MENKNNEDKKPYDYEPSEEEIKQKCAELRKKWSVNEHYKRLGLNVPKPYEIPTTYFVKDDE